MELLGPDMEDLLEMLNRRTGSPFFFPPFFFAFSVWQQSSTSANLRSKASTAANL